MKTLTKEEICETIRINTENFTKLESLSGYCGICSATASLVLSKNGYKNTLCLGNFYSDAGSYISGHAWLEIDGKIYDITAEQFNSFGFQYDRIHIGEVDNKYRSSIRLDNPSLELILQTFKENGWGSNYLSKDRLVNCLTGIMELDSLLVAA